VNVIAARRLRISAEGCQGRIGSAVSVLELVGAVDERQLVGDVP
jgi:hypothetical protein